MPDRIVLWLAEMDGAWVAGSLHFLKGNALYGRYWGCATPVRHLHFELCYYRAIEFGIHAGLSKIEAGAQGPNKVACYPFLRVKIPNCERPGDDKLSSYSPNSIPNDFSR